MPDLSASIFDVQRFSLHDGPGIRTVVFFQGCPLRCAWCQNPEAFLTVPRSEERVRRLTVDELWKELMRDRAYFGKEGGITLSGGEATVHIAFLDLLLERAIKENIHVTLETSGFFRYNSLESILQKIPLIYFDLKTMDDGIHRRFTGQSNTIILENARRLQQSSINVEFRLPIVQTVNDDQRSVNEFIDFLRGIGEYRVHLLRYHTMYLSKLDWLGVTDDRSIFPVQGDDEFAQVVRAFEEAGIVVVNRA